MVDAPKLTRNDPAKSVLNGAICPSVHVGAAALALAGNVPSLIGAFTALSAPAPTRTGANTVAATLELLALIATSDETAE